MRTIEKTMLFAIIFFFFGSFGWAQAQTDTEKTLQQKLDEVAGTKTPAKKEKKNKIAKTPVLDPADPNLSAHDKKVAMLARELQLRKELQTIEQQKQKMFTPAEKQAEQKITRQEKNQDKTVREAREAIINAQITGCPAGTVWASPNAEPPHMVTRIYQSVIVRIVNTGALTIDEISGPNGVMARNLCSRGAMTMTFFLGLLDSDQMNIPLTAIARAPDGGIATAQFNVYLDRNNYYRRVDNQIWQIQLGRLQQTR